MNTQKKVATKRKAAIHLRMHDDELRELEVIAKDEGRDLSDTMRCLLRLGVTEYSVTGTLYAVETQQRPRKKPGEQEEHQAFMRYLHKILKAAEEYMTKHGKLGKLNQQQNQAR